MRLFLLGLACVGLAAAVGADSPTTFDKDVLPVLQKNCQSCHRTGEVAPMSFMTYQDTRPWAKAIKAAVFSKKMPPWFADPKFGHFLNDRRLSDADVKTLIAWVDGGALEGNAKDKPAPVEFTEGWNIKPDVVVGMPNAFEVPSMGRPELGRNDDGLLLGGGGRECEAAGCFGAAAQKTGAINASGSTEVKR